MYLYICIIYISFVCTHIHPHTLPPASQNREDTDNTLISPSVNIKKNPPRQATSALHRLDEPTHLHPLRF